MLLADLQCWFTVKPVKNKEKERRTSFLEGLGACPPGKFGKMHFEIEFDGYFY